MMTFRTRDGHGGLLQSSVAQDYQRIKKASIRRTGFILEYAPFFELRKAPHQELKTKGLIISIHHPVLDGFGEMGGGDLLFAGQIRYRPGDLERAVILRSSCRKIRAGYFGRQLTRIIHNDQNGPRRGPAARARESTHSTPRAEGRGMLRVNTERRFFPDLRIGVWRRERINKSYFFKNRSIQSTVRWIRSIWWFGSWKPCGSRG